MDHGVDERADDEGQAHEGDDRAVSSVERLGPAAAKVPTRVAPNLLIRAMGLFDPSVRTIVGDLGKSAAYTAEKAKSKLGWTPRPIEDSITDTAQSLLDRRVAGIF